MSKNTTVTPEQTRLLEEYRFFISKKIVQVSSNGFEVAESEVNKHLFGHQNIGVRWMLKGGCRAGFQSFGTGKTIEQLELCRLTHIHHGKPTLIVAPLGVRHEFQRVKYKKMGLPSPVYVRTDLEIQAQLALGNPHMITNYERLRDGAIQNVDIFGTVSLDEASVLRGYGTKTYQTFLPLFKNVPFRYVFTATPSPNKYKELIHYAAFLGIMDTGQALTRFFQRNPDKAGDLTLYPHKEHEFWIWVSSWAFFLQKPSDLGFSDEGYEMPPLKVVYHPVKVDHTEAGADSWGQHKMFRDAAVSLQDAAREKRDSVAQRMDKALEIMAEKGDGAHWLLWHHLERERALIEKVVPGVKTVYGTQDLDEREKLIIGFSEGEFPILSTKPEIAGSGCNFQEHCHLNIFLGINDKFNDFIQAIYRTLRFRQQHQVEVHIIYAESEEPILRRLLTKWKQHDVQAAKMSAIIKEYGLLENAMGALKRSMDVTRREQSGRTYKAIHNDSVEECILMDDNCVGHIVTSIPFGTQYEYCPNLRDFGHTDNNAHFWRQQDFLTPQLLRILQPGRILAVHVKDRISFGNVNGDGFPQVIPFHCEAIQHYMSHGFRYCGMIQITTDVVRENNQTYRLGWSECCNDGSKMGVGMPEYVLLFRKVPTDTSKAYADIRVKKEKENYQRRRWQIDAAADWRSSGNRLMTANEIASMPMDRIQAWWGEYKYRHVYNYKQHTNLGAGLEATGRMPATFMLFNPAVNTDWTWANILRMRTLNAEQSKRNIENHVCPFQLDIVERLIDRFSNPGEVVFDPFAGIFSVPMTAIKMGRYGLGCELNPDYYDNGRKYCYEAEYNASTPTLFDALKIEQPEVVPYVPQAKLADEY